MTRGLEKKAPADVPLTAEERARAWKAATAFNKMIPRLDIFVRAFTGNPKMKVVASPITGTDGKKVMLRPPLALGDDLRHDKSLCDERDLNRASLCAACRASDDIWRKLYHEISHIIGGSMAEPKREVQQAMYELVDEWHPREVCPHGGDIKHKIAMADDYLPMFQAFDRYLWVLSQAIDDARVDTQMLKVNPGLKNSFYANTYEIFTNGVELPNGSRFFWRDAPPNAQIAMGLMLAGSGYDIEPEWLRLEIIDILEDEELRATISNVGDLDVHGHAYRVIDAFRRLSKLGLSGVDKCLPPEEKASLNKPHDEEEDNKDEQPDAGDDQEDSGGAGEPGGYPESGDGSGNDPDAAPEADPSESQESGDADSTGDGTTGDTASNGAFGDPDDSNAGGDRQDQEGGTDDAEPEGSPVPDDDGDDRSDGDGDSNEHHDEGTPESGGDDPADAGEQASDQGQSDASDADPEEGSEGSAGSTASAGDAGSDGERDASDAARDRDGEPDSNGASDESGTGDPEDQGEPTSDPGAASDPADVGMGEDALEEDGTLGEEVWEHTADPLRAAETLGQEDMASGDLAAELWEAGQVHEDPHVEPLSQGDGVSDEEDAYAKLLVRAQKAINDAISQVTYFDRASQEISGVKEYTFPQPMMRWLYTRRTPVESFMPRNAVIAPALMKARIVFAENQRSHHQRHLKSGKVDSRVLGRRAAVKDERLFKKRLLPKKRDYLVGITIDCSGSNNYSHNMEKAKRAAFAKAELLSRLGVRFYITAHTGGREEWMTNGWEPPKPGEMYDVWMFWVKKVDEPWTDATRQRLAAVQPTAENYDGHTLEFHRKYMEKQRATDKVLIYYTDGAMPAANYDEELVILLDEVQKCKKDGLNLLAVGIGTNSPEKYGFDTVRVDSDNDLIKVVEQLEKQLLK